MTHDAKGMPSTDNLCATQFQGLVYLEVSSPYLTISSFRRRTRSLSVHFCVLPFEGGPTLFSQIIPTYL